MISSEDLRFFALLASHTSLAATARALHVTPPSVTQRLQLLEEKLQIKLLHRQGKHTSLTDEGQLLSERAILILAEMEDLHQALSHQKHSLVGRLKILAPFGFGNQYIAPLVAQFQAQHRNLSVELELSDNPKHQQSKAWDLIIHIGELHDSTMIKSVLAKNQRFLCAAPSYLEKFGQPKTLQELRQHHCLALRENAEDVTLWRLRLNGKQKEETLRISPQLASNDGRVVKQWALDGYGIMLRSEWDVAAEINTGQLVKILPRYKLPNADIVALLGSKETQRSARTMQFLDELKRSLNPAPWEN